MDNYFVPRYFNTAALNAFGSCHIAKWLRFGITMSVEPGIKDAISFVWSKFIASALLTHKSRNKFQHHLL
jgi:hypothetical protein